MAGYASLEQFGLRPAQPLRQRRHRGREGLARPGHRQLLGGALLDVADNWMNLRRVELMVYTDNEPAIALYRKHGFEVEGELRDYAVRDGRHVNAYAMARLRDADPR